MMLGPLLYTQGVGGSRPSSPTTPLILRSDGFDRHSSGFRINRAADDAAGLNVSEGLRAEIIGLRQAVRNAEQATNLIQTAEGALNEVNAILIRMRELSVQSASSTVKHSLHSLP